MTTQDTTIEWASSPQIELLRALELAGAAAVGAVAVHMIMNYGQTWPYDLVGCLVAICLVAWATLNRDYLLVANDRNLQAYTARYRGSPLARRPAPADLDQDDRLPNNDLVVRRERPPAPRAAPPVAPTEELPADAGALRGRIRELAKQVAELAGALGQSGAEACHYIAAQQGRMNELERQRDGLVHVLDTQREIAAIATRPLPTISNPAPVRVLPPVDGDNVVDLLRGLAEISKAPALQPPADTETR